MSAPDKENALGSHFNQIIQTATQRSLRALGTASGAVLHPGDCFVIGDEGKHGYNASPHHELANESGAHPP